MALALFGQPLLEGVHQLLEAHGLQRGFVFFAQVFFHQLAQPVFRDVALQVFQIPAGAVEVVGEHPVEAVKPFFVFHQRGARQIVKVVQTGKRQPRLQRLQEQQKFLKADRHASGAQGKKKLDEHGAALVGVKTIVYSQF